MKNTIAAIALTVIMAASAFANGGIIVSDLKGNAPKDPCKETVKVDSGIIVSDIIGIIVSDFAESSSQTSARPRPSTAASSSATNLIN